MLMIDYFINVKRKISMWLWCIDSITLSVVLLLLSIGCFDLLKSIPVLSHRLQIDSFILFKKHLIFVFSGIFVMLLLSSLSFKKNLKIVTAFFLISLVLCLFVLILGRKINGSRRWLNIFGISLQPSLFIKDTLSIFLPNIMHNPSLTVGLLCTIMGLLLLEPDLGMTLLCLSTFIIQLFLSGNLEEILKKYRIMFYGFLPVSIIFLIFKGGYILSRIGKFLSENGDYQSNIALWNLQNTNFFTGGHLPFVPEAHCDFIFVSIISNSGIILGLIIVSSFLLLFVRNINNAKFLSPHKKYIVYGIMCQISAHFIFHIFSNLGFVPSKGIGCPFLSFGGSGILSLSISIGVLLSITKKKF